MHIVDGALTLPVIAVASTIAIAGTAVGLRQLTPERMPAAGMLAAVVFVASFIHVPVGPSSAHLVMGGLAGLLLGFGVFPIVLVGMLIQALMFGFGGVTVIGVNVLNVALPAALIGTMLQGPFAKLDGSWTFILGFIAGSAAMLGSAALVVAELSFSSASYQAAAVWVVVSHLPLALMEGFITGFAVVLIRQVAPQLLSLKASLQAA